MTVWLGIIGRRLFETACAPIMICGHDDVLLALHIEKDRPIPLRILVAGGEGKHRALAGAPRGGHITASATDAGSAGVLLGITGT